MWKSHVRAGGPSHTGVAALQQGMVSNLGSLIRKNRVT